MKILILTQKIDKNDDILGFFHGWVAEFAQHCEKVTVIALGAGEYVLPQNVKVFSLGKELSNQKSKVHEVKSKLKYIFNFYKYIWKERKNYDNVFVHMNPEYVVLGGLIWRLLGKKIGLWYMHKSVNLKLRMAEKLSHFIFSGTPESFLLKTKKLHITGHGIDLTQFKPINKKTTNDFFRIISVGRISPIKDYETLILAIRELRNEFFFPKISLEIVGSAAGVNGQDYLISLKELVIENNLSKKIKFIGDIPNSEVHKILGSKDLFINASLTGSLDKAILEAMAVGLLTLSCNTSAKNVYGSYQKDLFFKPQDSNNLSQKIKGIYFLSQNDKERIKNFFLEEVNKKHNLKKLIPNILNTYHA